jgi:iron-sulfur cluster assembly protein
MAITLTTKAAERMIDHIKNRGSGIGIRLSVKRTGCSGLGYNMEFVDSLSNEDKVFEKKGIKIVVDTKSLLYLSGTNIDYQKEGLNEGFQFDNPNSKAECGCGESFTI